MTTVAYIENLRTACSVEGCARPHLASGWCNAHYLRWQKHGTPLAHIPIRIVGNDQERFWSKVERNGPLPINRPDLGCCWDWTDPPNAKGYGVIGIRGTTRIAHRVAYEWAIGPVPVGMELDHFACDRTICVRPTHLRPVAPRENSLRGNGLAAQHATKTHCPQGHSYDEPNTYLTREGDRECRLCRRERNRQIRARRAIVS